MCLLSISIHLLGVCKLVKSAHIRYFCEISMIAHALVLKDTFTPRFASMQSILEFLENYEVILAKFSSSFIYMLSLSSFFFVSIFCKVGQIVWCIKWHYSIFVSNPDRLVNIWELYHIGNYKRVSKNTNLISTTKTQCQTIEIRSDASFDRHVLLQLWYMLAFSPFT